MRSSHGGEVGERLRIENVDEVAASGSVCSEGSEGEGGGASGPSSREVVVDGEVSWDGVEGGKRSALSFLEKKENRRDFFSSSPVVLRSTIDLGRRESD